MALKFDIEKAINLYFERNNNTFFPDSLRNILKYINDDPNIGDIRLASYILATYKVDTDYSLQSWERDFSCGKRGEELYPPCQEALDFYKSTSYVDRRGRTISKKNYYKDGIDPNGIPYYGRGLINLSGRENYRKYGPLIGEDLINNPQRSLIPINSYKIFSIYFGERTSQKVLSDDFVSARKSIKGDSVDLDSIQTHYNIWINIFQTIESTSTNGGNIFSISGPSTQSADNTKADNSTEGNEGINLPIESLGNIGIGDLESLSLNSNSFIPDNLKDFSDPNQLVIESPSGMIPTLSPDIESIPTLNNFTNVDSPIIQNIPNEDSSELKIPEEKESSQLNIPRLNPFFDPKISPTNISINLENFNQADQRAFVEGLGFIPFIWYNNVQIDYKDLEMFSLKYEDNIPSLKLVFRDSFGILRQTGIPADDTVITVFINSRSKNLRSIKMDFKILTFKDFGNGSYSITGVCNIPNLYIKKFQSFSNKTSHETLQEVAKDLGCGFCSNISNTDDRMTWINPGENSLDLISRVMENSYLSDDSFLHSYIDFYYNICYVDINKELLRDIDNDKMINSSGFDQVGASTEESSELIFPLILSNDKSLQISPGFISDFNIVNKSTKISIMNSYKKLSKSWNSLDKEFLLFDVESISPSGEKEIILKGRPDDTLFFKENVDGVWLGKQDKDNCHLNFNYSTLQNSINLDEIAKIGASLTLSTPNLNLYQYQKVKILFSVDKLTPTHEEQFFKRLSGDWLIVGIDFRYDNKNSYQVVNVIKTSLSLTPEEIEKSVAKKQRKEKEVSERNSNELSPLDDPNPEVDVNSTLPSKLTQPITNEDCKWKVIEGEGIGTCLKIDSTEDDYIFLSNSKVSDKKVIVLHHTAGHQWKSTIETIKGWLSRGDQKISTNIVINGYGQYSKLYDDEYSGNHWSAGSSIHKKTLSVEICGLGYAIGDNQNRPDILLPWKNESGRFTLRSGFTGDSPGPLIKDNGSDPRPDVGVISNPVDHKGRIPFTISSTLTKGSNIITTLSTSGVDIGMSVQGDGIPDGSEVVSILNSTSFQINNQSKVSGTNQTICINTWCGYMWFHKYTKAQIRTLEDIMSKWQTKFNIKWDYDHDVIWPNYKKNNVNEKRRKGKNLDPGVYCHSVMTNKADAYPQKDLCQMLQRLSIASGGQVLSTKF